MVENGQSQIRPIRFASRIHPRLPVEVIERADLIARLGREGLASPQRPSFDSFLLVRSGTGRHTVDFVDTPLEAGRLVRVRPGQAQIWDTEGSFEATLALSQRRALPITGQDVVSSAFRDLDRDSMRTAEELVEVLRREQERFEGDDASIGLMNALFEALCCIFDRIPGQQPSPLSKPYSAFVEALESNLSHSHTVRELAGRAGYSERTITRACQKVSGQSAREVLNQRLVLEAKRLLAHTDQPASEIATDLGFSEPTNFHKFFTRHAGVRPGDFRRDYRQAART